MYKSVGYLISVTEEYNILILNQRMHKYECRKTESHTPKRNEWVKIGMGREDRRNTGMQTRKSLYVSGKQPTEQSQN
jgi:hypothetical protein